MAVDFIQGRNAPSDYAGNVYVEISGLSTDTKPTGNFLTGSIFLETNTGKVFFYNRAGSAWVEQFSFQD